LPGSFLATKGLSEKLICKELPYAPVSYSSLLSDGKEEGPEAAKGKGREIVLKAAPGHKPPAN